MAETKIPKDPFEKSKNELSAPIDDIIDGIKNDVKNKISKPTIRKKTLGEKFKDTFLADSVENVKNNVIKEIIIPSIGDFICDIFTSTIEGLFHGGYSGRRRGNSSWNNQTKVSYTSYSGSYKNRGVVEGNSIHKGSPTDRVEFKTRMDAELVVDGLANQLEEYGQISVADFYDFAGIDDIRTTDWKIGWTDMRGVKIRNVRGKYIIEMPTPDNI